MSYIIITNAHNYLYNKEIVKTILKTKHRTFRFSHVYIYIPKIQFPNCKRLKINLGTNNEEFKLRSQHNYNRILAYNKDKCILTFEIGGFLHTKTKKINLEKSLLSVYLTPKLVKKIVEYDLYKYWIDNFNFPVVKLNKNLHHEILNILLVEEFFQIKVDNLMKKIENVKKEKDDVLHSVNELLKQK